MSENENKYNWLTEVHQSRKKRTFDLGKKAIDYLVSSKEKVSYRNISKISQMLDPEGKGVHQNSIKNNEELYQYYNLYSNTKKKLLKRKIIKSTNFNDIIKKQKNSSKIEGKNKKYKKYTKEELIHLLIQAEELISKERHNWVVSQFEKHPQ